MPYKNLEEKRRKDRERKRIQRKNNDYRIKDNLRIKNSRKYNWTLGCIKRAKERAKKKSLEFDKTINRNYLLDLYKKQKGICYWFGIKMLSILDNRNPFQPSIDRIDSNKGYTKDNIVICTLSANQAKSDADPKKWMEFCDSLLYKKTKPLYKNKLSKSLQLELSLEL